MGRTGERGRGGGGGLPTPGLKVLLGPRGNHTCSVASSRITICYPGPLTGHGYGDDTTGRYMAVQLFNIYVTWATYSLVVQFNSEYGVSPTLHDNRANMIFDDSKSNVVETGEPSAWTACRFSLTFVLCTLSLIHSVGVIVFINKLLNITRDNNGER